MKTAVFASITALTLAACSTTPPREESAGMSTAKAATVVLMSASGSLVSGKLTATPMGNGVHFTGEIGGLGRGSTHAIHVHEKGDCSAADATSAGGHFNSLAKPHGKVDNDAHHAGDMDNILANRDGVAKVSVHASGVTLGGDSANDIAGRAVIVHAAPDDYRSQPAGNAGARVACGIIKVTP